MKILMILEGDFPPDIRVENEIESLLNNGHLVHILCLNKKRNRPLIEIKNNLTIHRIPIAALIYKSSIACLKVGIYFHFWKSNIRKLYKLHGPFDVIHIHDLQLSKVGYYFKKHTNCKLVIDLHENWPALLDISTHTQTFFGKLFFSRNQWDNYEKLYLAKADKIIVVVDEAKLRIEKLGIAKEKIHVVTNALNLTCFEFEVQKPIDDKIVFVYGGGINKHRGLQNIINAIPYITTNIPFEVWIIGEGNYLPALKQLAEHLNINEKVVFYGWKNQNELLKLISQAHVALIPHLLSDHTNSTIPHKLFQYMYAGIPILSSDCAPLKRIIEETNSGLIYSEKSYEDIAEKMSHFINDRNFKTQKSNSKQWVENKYNWLITEKELITCYNQLKFNII